MEQRPHRRRPRPRADDEGERREANHPGIRERLVDEKDGKADLRRFVNVYVNDEDVRFIGGLDAELSDGDQVTVLPAVAGGC